jgi:hypothetical protein
MGDKGLHKRTKGARQSTQVDSTVKKALGLYFLYFLPSCTSFGSLTVLRGTAVSVVSLVLCITRQKIRQADVVYMGYDVGAGIYGAVWFSLFC